MPSSVTGIGLRASDGCSSLVKFCYNGLTDERENIKAENGNGSLVSATCYCFTSNGDKEEASGNWRYYDTEGKTGEKAVK